MIKIVSKRTRSMIAATAAGLALLSTAAHADLRDYELINLNGQHTIVAAWWAESGTNEPWHRIGGISRLAPRNTATVKVDGGGYCLADFVARFDDGRDAILAGVNLCREWAVAFK
jgi:hypothetical protein